MKLMSDGNLFISILLEYDAFLREVKEFTDMLFKQLKIVLNISRLQSAHGCRLIDLLSASRILMIDCK